MNSVTVGLLTEPRMKLGNTGLCPIWTGSKELFSQWFNDPRIYLHMGDMFPFPFSVDDTKRYIESHRKDTWIIVAKIENEGRWVPIGYSGLFIRARHRIGIVRHAIGDREFLSKGHAKRARILTLAWAFNECDLVSIVSTVSSSNKNNLGLCLKVGFGECGRYKNARFENGKRYDEIHLQITKEEFYENYSNLTDTAIQVSSTTYQRERA